MVVQQEITGDITTAPSHLFLVLPQNLTDALGSKTSTTTFSRQGHASVTYPGQPPNIHTAYAITIRGIHMF